MTADIPYFTAHSYECRLDVHQPSESAVPKPTLMFMHGGGWAEGFTKETDAFLFLPLLQRGWIVVNVDYRPSSVAPAPAAVEDCLHALHWIARNAKQYHVDLEQLVIAGLSAGGHLALSTGMIPPSMLGGASADLPKPAAIVNWCGITDVVDLVHGPNRQEFAVSWVGDRPDQLALAKSVSPLNHVRAGLPPIITIHGDGDRIVPYSHAVRLHEALSIAGVKQKLITLPGAGHPSLDGYLGAYPQILEFLAEAGVTIQKALC